MTRSHQNDVKGLVQDEDDPCLRKVTENGDGPAEASVKSSVGESGGLYRSLRGYLCKKKSLHEDTSCQGFAVQKGVFEI